MITHCLDSSRLRDVLSVGPVKPLGYVVVPSMALASWRSDRQQRLDELLAAHQTVGGAGPGRRWRTRELNWALTLRLAGEFQGFARHLHDLAVDHFVATLAGGNTQLADTLRRGRQRTGSLTKATPIRAP